MLRSLIVAVVEVPEGSVESPPQRGVVRAGRAGVPLHRPTHSRHQRPTDKNGQRIGCLRIGCRPQVLGGSRVVTLPNWWVL